MQPARALSCGLLRALLVSVMLLMPARGRTGTDLEDQSQERRHQRIVSQIAAITGKTFVVDPRVKGKVTVISNAEPERSDVYELFLSVLRVPVSRRSRRAASFRCNNRRSPAGGSPMDEAGRSRQNWSRGSSRRTARRLERTGQDSLRPMIPQYGNIAAITNPNVAIISDHGERRAM